MAQSSNETLNYITTLTANSIGDGESYSAGQEIPCFMESKGSLLCSQKHTNWASS